ncbi:MAG: F0F1 ATP synthase subunit A [Nitrospinota bacterium]
MAVEHEAANKATETSLELPSFMDLLGDLHHEVFGISLHHWVPVIMSLIVASLLLAVTYYTTRDLKKIPQGMQAFLEVVIEGMQGFYGEILGSAASAFLPLIGSLFIYIYLMNIMGFIPLFHSPTSSPNTTIALAVIVFFVTQYAGITRNGVVGYLKHFVGEPVWMAPLIFPIHIIGELARPLSLSMRLFGNIMGEDTAIAILVGLGVSLYFIPIQFPILVLGLLTTLIQAVVFTILSSVYIGGAVGHQDEH